jgi:hypothetical protein
MKNIFVLFFILVIPIISSAEEVPIKPKQVFKLFAALVSSPSSEDWVLTTKSEVQLQFQGVRSNEGMMAMVSFFTFPGPHDKNSIISAVKKHVKESATASGGAIQNESYFYTEERGYPCVKVNHVMKVTFTIKGAASPSEGNTNLQQHLLMCLIPKYENTGLMVGFSYSNREVIQKNEAEAEEFISGVKLNIK